MNELGLEKRKEGIPVIFKCIEREDNRGLLEG